MKFLDRIIDRKLKQLGYAKADKSVTIDYKIRGGSEAAAAREIEALVRDYGPRSRRV